MSLSAQNEKQNCQGTQDKSKPPAYSTGSACAPSLGPSDVSNQRAMHHSYGSLWDNKDIETEYHDKEAKFLDDGRIDIYADEKSQSSSRLLGFPLQDYLSDEIEEASALPPYIFPMIDGVRGESRPPTLNVVMHVAGCRKEFQPFLALGQVLQRKHGHRVRIATHPEYREEMENGGLEFSSIGIPKSRASTSTSMANRPNFMSLKRSSTASTESINRKEIYEMIQACWRSCYDTGEQEAKIGFDNVAPYPPTYETLKHFS